MPKTYNIGRTPDADIILSSTMCSREHAIITIYENGDIFLEDKSNNGTKLNGSKINNKRLKIKRGDTILFAGIESLDWSKLELAPIVLKDPIDFKVYIKPLSFGLGLIFLLFFSNSIYQTIIDKYLEITSTTMTSTAVYDKYKNSVAMLELNFFIVIETPLKTVYYGLNDKGEIDLSTDKSELLPFKSHSTAFFIDKKDVLITNEHCIRPWRHDKSLKTYFNEKLRPFIFEKLEKQGYNESDLKIYEEQHSMYIYPNGVELSDKEKIKCMIHKESGDESIDLASIKILEPEKLKNVYKIKFSDIQFNPAKIKVNSASYTIGYPLGENIALNEKSIIECSSTIGSFSQAPSTNYVQYSSPTTSGGSGSPVFDQYGKLVAVTYLSIGSGQKFIRGVLVKHIDKVQ